MGQTVRRHLHIPSGTPEDGVSTRWEGAALHRCGPSGLHNVDLPHDEHCELFSGACDSTLRVLVVCEGHPTPDGVGGLNPYHDVVIVGGGVDRPVVIPTIRLLI